MRTNGAGSGASRIEGSGGGWETLQCRAVLMMMTDTHRACRSIVLETRAKRMQMSRRRNAYAIRVFDAGPTLCKHPTLHVCLHTRSPGSRHLSGFLKNAALRINSRPSSHTFCCACSFVYSICPFVPGFRFPPTERTVPHRGKHPTPLFLCPFSAPPAFPPPSFSSPSASLSSPSNARTPFLFFPRAKSTPRNERFSRLASLLSTQSGPLPSLTLFSPSQTRSPPRPLFLSLPATLAAFPVAPHLSRSLGLRLCPPVPLFISLSLFSITCPRAPLARTETPSPSPPGIDPPRTHPRAPPFFPSSLFLPISLSLALSLSLFQLFLDACRRDHFPAPVSERRPQHTSCENAPQLALF